ncbi:MAG: acyltransferase [Marmoricola sp.]|nr:acyltransferase [Marmoricola sp.]
MSASGKPPADGPPGYRGDIDGLRAVAVTLVVLFHIGWSAFPAGYVGVDVFYVLSGYLITALLLRELSTTGTISISGFYARRIRRLLPLSAVVLVSTAVASRFLTPTLDRPAVGSDLRSAALYFSNWHFAAESTRYMADTTKSPVLHYWSLAVEEQFYVVWPLLLLLAVGATGLALHRWEVARRRVVLVLVLVGGASFVLSAATSAASGPWAYFGLHTRGWELAVGAALAVAGTAVTRIPALLAPVLGWGGLALVIGSAVLMSGDTIFPGTAALVPVLGTAMVVAAGAVPSRVGAARLLSLSWPRYVGRISYAWYLWHWPCIVLVGGLNEGSTGGPGEASGSGGAHSVWRMTLAVCLSLLLAVVSHHVVENPARRTPWLVGHSGRSLALGAVLTAAGVLASFLLVQPASSGTAAGASVRTAQLARADEATVPNGCYQGLDMAATPHECQFGDPDGTRTIVLVGDSNSRHWFYAYEALAKARHWKFYFWGKSGCPMVESSVWLGTVKAEYASCDTWRRGVLHEISRLGVVDAVVLARARLAQTYVMVDSHTRAHPAQLRPAWEKAVAKTFDSLAGLTRHVVFMRPIPYANLDVPACIADDPQTARTRCDFPRRVAFGSNALDGVEDEAVAQHPGSAMVDLNAEICPGDPCPVISDQDQIIYLNQNHITATYGKSLWPLLARDLQAAIGPAPRDTTQ